MPRMIKGGAIHKHLIEIALEVLGPAPRNFAFMVMGNQVRGEAYTAELIKGKQFVKWDSIRFWIYLSP